MCGLAGYLQLGEMLSIDHVNLILSQMAKEIESRGPDAFGQWVDTDAGIGLVHRRLAIVDLTASGSQPMVSKSGRFILAFNGEIYNHLELRKSIADANLIDWRGQSDTETLLAAFESWGVQSTLERSAGMFAFAMWDRDRKVLTLGRDRIGEKPLYYGLQGRGKQAVFLFGSDLAALRQHPAFEPTINRDSLALYLRYSCIGGEYSIYEGVNKLKPGNYLEVSRSQPNPVIKKWWSANDVALRGISKPFKGSPEDASDHLEFLLKNVLKQQMIADVPIGAFLSGGVDSSTLVALMQAQSNRPIKTFSIGFNEDGYNEAVHAKAISQHLKTEHYELYVSAQQAINVIPSLPTLYTEPFADSSQIPTYLVSQLAKKQVSVCISGDGGDELFCGYRRYKITDQIWKKLQLIPKIFRSTTKTGINTLSINSWDFLGGLFNISRLGENLHKGLNLLESQNYTDLYKSFISNWDNPNSLVLGGYEPTLYSFNTQLNFTNLREVERMMELDLVGYLPDDVLVKVDRAAMGVSLETRAPMLDHRIVEFALSLPFDYKLRNGVTKWPLRELLLRHVPRELIERPKMGFGVPIGQWLRGPLRDWAETLLSESRLRHEGYFNPIPIRQKWSEHLSGQRNWEHQLWAVLVFQTWHESNR